MNYCVEGGIKKKNGKQPATVVKRQDGAEKKLYGGVAAVIF